MLDFGSVCSGIDAASVAWSVLAWRAAWFAEIEAFPSAVLSHHYPDVPNLGDMTKIARAVLAGEVKAPSVLVGGTPCQSFSVAGLREGLADARGQLTVSFVELANAIDAVRLKRGESPSVVLWENVPGVLSDRGNAFGCFLGALAGEDHELKPAGKRWPDAGCVYGPQRAIAWRVLDAQYFGLAQRRRRVFVVASSRDGFDPANVLFEFQGGRRDSAPSRETSEGATGTIARSVALRGREGGGTAELGDNVGGTLRASTGGGDKPHVLVAGTVGTSLNKGATIQDALSGMMVAHTLRAEGFDASEDGTGRGTPLVPVAFVQNSRDEVRLFGGDGQTVGALAAEPGAKQQCYVATTGVRRLTPRECERLQGFKDDYTLVPYRGKLAADGPRYKSLGNSMAVPVMRWIGHRIDAEIARIS